MFQVLLTLILYLFLFYYAIIWLHCLIVAKHAVVANWLEGEYFTDRHRMDSKVSPFNCFSCWLINSPAISHVTGCWRCETGSHEPRCLPWVFDSIDLTDNLLSRIFFLHCYAFINIFLYIFLFSACCIWNAIVQDVSDAMA